MEQPSLTPEILLNVTRNLVWARIKRQFPKDAQPDFTKVVVTYEDIEVTADALKFDAFYVPGYVYRAAAELAQKQGCLRESENLREPL